MTSSPQKVLGFRARASGLANIQALERRDEDLGVSFAGELSVGSTIQYRH